MDNDSGEEWIICEQTAEPYAEPTNDVDIERVLCKMKNGKTTGHDQIPAASIKEGEKELTQVIYELVSKNMGGRDHRSGNVARCVQVIREGT